MKPTRNRYYCLAARRTKMIFETENNANNFIKFNRKEMEELGNKVPVRCYYCSYCSGWHVTSNPNVNYFETHKSRAELALENQIELLRRRKIDKNNVFAARARNYHQSGDYSESARAYLQGYHQLKGIKDETADKYLLMAFEEEWSLLNDIVQNPFDGDIDPRYRQASKILSLLKKCIKTTQRDYSKYFDAIVPFVESFFHISEMGFPIEKKMELLTNNPEQCIVFVNGAKEFHQNGRYYEAAVSYLKGFRITKSVKGETAEELLHLAFEEVRSLIDAIANNPYDGIIDIRHDQARLILKRLKKMCDAAKLDYSKYFDELAPTVNSFPKASEKGFSIVMKSEYTLEAIPKPVESEEQKEEKLKLQREKQFVSKLKSIKQNTAIAKGNLAVGQLTEAKRLFHKCVQDISVISQCSELKPQVLIIVNRLMELHKEIESQEFLLSKGMAKVDNPTDYEKYPDNQD